MGVAPAMPSPYSDDLYSANDAPSDSESLSNELSPTDGFFRRNQMSPNHMVPDPSLDRKDRVEEDKVLIPRNETRNESGSASRSTTSPTLGQLFPSQNRASSHTISHPASPPPSSNTPTSPSSHRGTQSSRTQGNLFSQANHSTQGPPPAYTPTTPTNPSYSTNIRSYNTFEPQRQGQGLATEPQSMGRPADDPDERTPLSENTFKKPSRRRLFIKKLLFLALVIAVAIGVMTTLLSWGKSTSTKDPKKNPNAPGGELPVGKEPSLGLPTDNHGPYCTAKADHNGELFYDFSLDGTLGVQQTTFEPDENFHGFQGNSYPVRTSGELKIRKLPIDSAYSTRGVAQLDVYTTNPAIVVRKTWDEETRTMTISTPRSIRSSDANHDECVSLEITVWLPEGASFSALSILSTSLTLRVFDNINVKVKGKADFASVSGDIIFPKIGTEGQAPPNTYPLDSRHITVETVSGNIKGIYPLYDYLKLGSQSGDIAAGIYPQAVDPAEPETADLEVSTASGSIKVNLPAEIPRYSPPARDYVTRISSVSGNIEGAYFLGSVGTFKSTSGDLTAKVLPVIPNSPSTDPDDAPKSQFETWTVSGKHDFDLLDPVFISLLPTNGHDQHDPNNITIGDDDPYNLMPPDLNKDNLPQQRSAISTKKWRTLSSSHKSSSNNIAIHYPAAWEGTISGRTVSGDITVHGDEVKIIKYSKGWAYKELLAGKGASKKGEGSTSEMSSISGNLKAVVGET